MFILNEIIKKIQLILPLRHCRTFCIVCHRKTDEFITFLITVITTISVQKREAVENERTSASLTYVVHTLCCELRGWDSRVELLWILGESLVFIIWIPHVAVKFINFNLKSRKLFYAAYQEFSNFPHYPLNREFCVFTSPSKTQFHNPASTTPEKKKLKLRKGIMRKL